MAVNMATVKELREKSGAGIMDCKNALSESNGDLDAAVDWLRAKGLAKAAKKAGRVAAEGLVGVHVSGKTGAAVEVNSETDFVARNETFQKMVSDIASVAIDTRGDLSTLLDAPFPGAGKTVREHVSGMVGTIGENMTVRRTAVLRVEEGVVVPYVHNRAADGLGSIGVLVALESTGDKTKLETLGKQVAMHVAATNPLAVGQEDLDPDTVERERKVLIAEARESGKPDNIIDKMIEGRIRKFYQEVVLLSQTFVIDGENTVEKALKLAGDEMGTLVRVAGFVRFHLGEGIEKEVSDFAAEVAAAVKG